VSFHAVAPKPRLVTVRLLLDCEFEGKTTPMIRVVWGGTKFVDLHPHMATDWAVGLRRYADEISTQS
jgi:hypothetical protein